LQVIVDSLRERAQQLGSRHTAGDPVNGRNVNPLYPVNEQGGFAMSASARYHQEMTPCFAGDKVQLLKFGFAIKQH
jgi:hypothetical protein